MTLTVLAEDHAHPDHPELKSDHGFSIHVQMEGKNILYDFGDTGTLLHNSRVLGIDLSKVDTAVLSHGHYDHSGDMGEFLQINDRAQIRHGRGAFHPRWSISDGSPKDVGVPVVPTEEVVKRLMAVDSVTDEECCIVLPAAPGPHGRPAGNAALLAGPEGNRLQDDFTDELTLALRGDTGLVVLTACSHRGILNIVDQVKTYCPLCPVSALIGGFHLLKDKEKPEKLESIGLYLNENLPSTRVITGHCTDDSVMNKFAETLDRPVERLHVGMVMEF